MTDSLPMTPDPEDLDGHTIEELADYLDRGRMPPDPSIDDSPRCQITLAALERLRLAAPSLILAEAAAQPPLSTWIADVLAGISMDSRAGRDLPMPDSTPGATTVVTEGALRGLVREIGDAQGALLIGRIRIGGDPALGQPLTFDVDAHVVFGEPVHEAVADLRAAVLAELPQQVGIRVGAIDVRVTNVIEVPGHVLRTARRDA